MSAAGKTFDEQASHVEHQVCLGLGSNIRPEENLPRAVSLLRKQLFVEALSTAWETPAVGAVSEPGSDRTKFDRTLFDRTLFGRIRPAPDFLNAAALVRTPLSPEALKSQVIRKVETQLGRIRTGDKNAPRTIDIDILIVDGVVLEPLLWKHAFLAVPVAELVPDLLSPANGEKLEQVARRLRQRVSIEPRPEVLSGEWAGSD